MKVKIWKLLALTLLLNTPGALAALPHSQTIVGRLVRNSGRGIYTIEQDVQFRTAGEPLTLRERWVIENGETMRLNVSGGPRSSEPVRFEVNYASGRRTAPDLTQPGGPVKAAALSPELIEPLFDARSSGGFLSALYRARIAPPGAFREKPRFTKADLERSPTFQAEPYVRLGRTSGAVTWIFGEPTASATARLSPAVWIEQDGFRIRRIRYPSEAEVTADKFITYPGNLQYPRERTVTWGANTVSIHVVSVKQGPGPRESAARGAHLPDIAQVREFYSRFR